MIPPVVARLKAAGLLPIAERVAASHEVPLATLLAVTGRVSPAQAALFRALDCAAPKVAALLGWGVSAVERELGMPEPAPTPAPKSGARRLVEANDEVSRIIAAVAAKHGLSVGTVLASDKEISAARRALVVALTACGMSQLAIAARLGIRLRAVQLHQRAAGIKPALAHLSAKKAA